MKSHFLFIILLCSLSNPAVAQEKFDDEEMEEEGPAGVWSTDFGFAHESIADLLTEEEDSDRIKATRLNTKYSTEEKNILPWSLNLIHTTRDYKTRDLDNNSIAFKMRMGKLLPERNKSVWTQNGQVKYRRKRYEDLKTNSFDQFGGKYTLHYLAKKDYKVTATAGFDRFEFPDSDVKDYTRFNEKIVARKVLLSDDIRIQAGYKREELIQNAAGRKKAKNEYLASIRWRPEHLALHMIKLSANAGTRDAKDEEGNDKDLDFKYVQPKVRLDHHISDNIRFYHSGEYFKKDYRVDGRYDHEGFEVIQGWKVTPRKTKEDTAYFNIVGFYKEFDYKNANQLDFRRGGISVRGTFRQKKWWKTYGGLEFDRRDQQDDTQDRNDYSIMGGAENKINDRLRLTLDLEYSKWDYTRRGSKDLYRAKVNVSYKI